MKKYIVTDSQTNTFIDQFDSFEEAQKEIEKFERHDKSEGIFTENFYQIIIK